MKQGCCTKYSGEVFRQGKCKADIDVRELVGGDDWGWLRRTPCFLKNKSLTTCDKYTEPTNQEIEDHEKWADEIIERLNKASPLISELKKEYGETGGKGTRPCPVCGNTLNFTVSSLNGHVHGKCETKDCLSWME